MPSKCGRGDIDRWGREFNDLPCHDATACSSTPSLTKRSLHTEGRVSSWNAGAQMLQGLYGARDPWRALLPLLHAGRPGRPYSLRRLFRRLRPRDGSRPRVVASVRSASGFGLTWSSTRSVISIASRSVLPRLHATSRSERLSKKF